VAKDKNKERKSQHPLEQDNWRRARKLKAEISSHYSALCTIIRSGGHIEGLGVDRAGRTVNLTVAQFFSFTLRDEVNYFRELISSNHISSDLRGYVASVIQDARNKYDLLNTINGVL
jgi:hypothetical protein